jgi:hypothetical protein
MRETAEAEIEKMLQQGVDRAEALLAKPCKWSGRQFLSSAVFTFCGCEKSQETTPFTGCSVATCTFRFTILGLGSGSLLKI